ncbi:hypothetical protein ON058_08605 [Demequina sp. B12]|uniref:hypothetical protein n=1 Tax=Demequina sp. B12 TaxID=2992757 RepID=UPI00237A18C2|nr:hypothetical protein [Demequina sp. B12]MDE0573476.1 hypothetical protein [Demequina sp. B12]
MGELVSMVGSAVVLASLARVLLVYVVARVRLTDIVGWIAGSGFALVTWNNLAAGMGGWAVAGLGMTLIAAGVLTGRSVRRMREDPEHEFVGIFLLGKPPHGIKNWLGYQRN